MPEDGITTDTLSEAAIMRATVTPSVPVMTAGLPGTMPDNVIVLPFTLIATAASAVFVMLAVFNFQITLPFLLLW